MHALVSVAAETAARADVPAFVREVGGIAEYRFANGLRLLHLPMPSMPVALAMITCEVGSRHEPAGLKGASHMIEHMMFKGSARFHRGIGTSIHDLLHPLGAETNATTWLDRTHYFDLVPSEHLDLALEIEADRLQALRMDADDLEAERGVVLNEHDLYAGDPMERLHQAVWKTAYGDHPYGHPVLGTRDDILGLERDALFAYWRRHYRPGNATLTLIGDIARDRALALAGRHFGTLRDDPAPAADDTPLPSPQAGERRVVVRQPAPPEAVMLAWRGPDGRSADADALDLLGLILLGGKGARLYRPLIASGLAVAGWHHAWRLRQPGLFQLQAQPAAPGDHARVERLLREAVAAVVRDGLGADELTRAKGFLRGQLAIQRDGPVAIALQLNEAIAAGDWTRYPTQAERIAALTADDLQRAAARHLVDARLTVGHLVQDACATEDR